MTASKIKEIREFFGLTRAEWSKILRVPLTTLTEWENGRKTVSAAAQRLLELLQENPALVERYRAKPQKNKLNNA